VTGFKHVARETLADNVYSELRAAILSGGIEDGAELNQVWLAREFNVSRVPIREALRRLQAEHLVIATPYQHYIVRGIKPEAVREMIDIRAELEVFAIRRHIPNLTPKIIQELKERNSRLRKQDDTELWLMGDVELHEIMNGEGTEAAGLVRDLRERIHRYLRTVASTRERQRQACKEHDRIIAAMAKGDVEAAEQAVRQHISHTQAVILSYLNRPDSDRGAQPEPDVDREASSSV
jgi:DNA-binding GntR family transcriptional regulator